MFFSYRQNIKLSLGKTPGFEMHMEFLMQMRMGETIYSK